MRKDYLDSIKAYAPTLFGKLWGQLMMWGSILTTLAGIIAFSIWATRATPPLPVWNLAWVVGGAIIVLFANFLVFHEQRIKIQKLQVGSKADISAIIQELEAHSITLGSSTTNLASILGMALGEMADGIKDSDLVSILSKQFPDDKNITEIWGKTKLVLQQLSIYKIIYQDKRLEANIRAQWDQIYWKFTDLGNDIALHLQQRKKEAPRKDET